MLVPFAWDGKKCNFEEYFIISRKWAIHKLCHIIFDSLFPVFHNGFKLFLMEPYFFKPYLCSRDILESVHANSLELRLRKKNVLVIEKTSEIRGWRPRICKHFEVTRTIYSNSERSEQFLVTECFLTCSCRFLRSNKLDRTIEIHIGKKYWGLETCRKS